MRAGTDQAKRAIASYLPILSWLPSYDRRQLRPDIIAGLTVWALLVPEAMAYASLAGVPPEAGLYAALGPLVLYAVFSTSRHVTVGPSSAIAVMVAATVAPLAGGDSERYLTLTAGLALVVGIILIAGGVARIGFVSDFLARPVVTGFITGLALVIAIGQADKLFGVEAEGDDFFQKAWDLIIHLGDTHVETFLVGAGCLALILGLRRFVPRAPAALIAVAGSIIAVSVADLDARGVHIAGDIPAGLPPLEIPKIGFAEVVDLLPGAFALALVVYAESIAAARSLAVKHSYEVDPNQELIALGACNIGAGVSQGFCVDVSLSRSAVADEAGAKSQVSGLVNAALILTTVLALTPLFHDLPDAALAAVVISAVVHLVEVDEFRRLWALQKTDFALAAICLLGVLVFDVLPGLVIAVVASLVALVYRASRPHAAELGASPSDGAYRDIARHPDAETVPGLVILRFEAELFFANATYFREQVRGLLAGRETPVGAVLIDAEAISNLDTTGAAVLTEFRAELEDAGVELLLARVHHAVRAVLRRSGLEEELGADRIYLSLQAAVDDYRARRADDGQSGDPSAT